MVSVLPVYCLFYFVKNQKNNIKNVYLVFFNTSKNRVKNQIFVDESFVIGRMVKISYHDFSRKMAAILRCDSYL